MTAEPVPAYDFADELSAEVARVLADPAFVKAPVQSRLLSYLCEQTLAGDGPLSQYAIAVDGLGREDSYDLTSDSYPRVQISRLRRNLADYYSRIAPGHGLAVHLDKGDYRLHLAPPGKAYPERLGNTHAEPQDDADAARTVPSDAARPARGSRDLLLRAAGALAALVILAFGLFNLFSGSWGGTGSAGAAAPRIAVEVDIAPLALGKLGDPQLAEHVRFDMESQVAGSFIATLARAGTAADYRLTLHSAPALDAPDRLRLELFDREGARAYVSTLALPADSETLDAVLGGELAQLLTPDGLVAQLELKAHDRARSDYLCFLRSESAARPTVTSTHILPALLDRCLARYPRSDYAPFWLARKALLLYQADLRQGLPIRRDGEAWDLTTRALEADPFNSYANALAARIVLADGECAAAESYFLNMIERGGYYPVLAGMIATEAAPCGSEFAQAAGDWRARIGAMSQGNRTLDPLSQLYVMLAVLALEDRATTERLASTRPIEESSADVEGMLDELTRAVESRGYARSNATEIEAHLARFVWNPRARAAITRSLR
ncbi:MAG: hypothetical protein VX072_10545 [Pseudomonadota bacterium]|nr:hypothetical protein [Pseudomonadota bacterium]